MANRQSHSNSEERDGRVVHLTTVHHPQDPRITHKQLPTLREAGFEVTLVASGRDEEMPSDLPTVALPPTQSRLQRLPRLWTAYRRSASIGADLYHLHDPELIPVGYLLKRTVGATIIYDMHENYRGRGGISGRALRGLERWCFSWVDHVVTAERSYETIVSGRDVPYTFVGNYYKPYGSSPPPSNTADFSSSWHLLYTGSIADHRGLRTMLDLAAHLRARDNDDSLCLVGICRRTRQRRRADERIRTQNLGDVLGRVGWTEYVSAPDMVPYYRQADVGLALCEPHQNLVGSLLTKFYEYLHYGLPIICSDFPLWRDFVEENSCGAAVPPGDARAVLEVLTRWRKQPEVYREHARNARAVADQYRWENMEGRLVQVYRDLLSSEP